MDFWQGKLHQMNRNPGTAVKLMRSASKNLSYVHACTGNIAFDLLSQQSSAFAKVCEGLEQIVRGQLSNAKTVIQAGLVEMQRDVLGRIEHLSKEDYDELEGLFRGAQLDCNQFRILYLLTSGRDKLNNEHFDDAVASFGDLVNICEETVLPVLENLPQVLQDLGIAEYNMYRGFKAHAEAEKARAMRDWDLALSNYSAMEKAWEEAASYAIASGLPQAQMLQETLINNSAMIIGPARNRCKKERGLYDEIAKLERQLDELRQDLMKSAANVDVNVTNSAEAKQVVDLNIKFVNKLETDVRDKIGKIVDALKEVPAPADVKRQISEECEATLDSGEHGVGFLERTKKMCESIGQIAKSAEGTLKPILGIVKTIGLIVSAL